MASIPTRLENLSAADLVREAEYALQHEQAANIAVCLQEFINRVLHPVNSHDRYSHVNLRGGIRL